MISLISLYISTLRNEARNLDGVSKGVEVEVMFRGGVSSFLETSTPPQPESEGLRYILLSR